MINDKNPVTRICKELPHVNKKKAKNQAEKWAEHLNRHHMKNNIQLVNKYMNTDSHSLVIREMKIKITMNHTTHLPDWQKFLILTIPSIG